MYVHMDIGMYVRMDIVMYVHIDIGMYVHIDIGMLTSAGSREREVAKSSTSGYTSRRRRDTGPSLGF